MQHWNEMAQAMSSWHYGKTAASRTAEARADNAD